jgi:hypothetical protein
MNRLEFVQNLLQQPAPTCPFLDAVDSETRVTLLEQHPDPHALPETKLLELAQEYGYTATPTAEYNDHRLQQGEHRGSPLQQHTKLEGEP